MNIMYSPIMISIYLCDAGHSKAVAIQYILGGQELWLQCSQISYLKDYYIIGKDVVVHP